MSRKDILILTACTLVILSVLIFVLGNSKPSGKTGPQPPNVTPITTTFDQTTIQRVEKNFPVNLDLNGLGRPDPFAGI